MEGALIILIVTVATGMLLWLFDRRRRPEESEADTPELSAEEAGNNSEADSGECCGLHIVCEKDSLAIISTEIEYYDDEELDRFAGRAATDYTDAETEEFRDVLLTLRPEEIAGWSRSLRLRGIELPEAVREELLLIVSEARAEL